MVDYIKAKPKTGQYGRALAWAIVAVFLVTAGAAVYYYRVYLDDIASPPCSQPLSYRIDSFDGKFGISQDRFKQAIADAAQIWTRAGGRELFRYQKDGAMPISLVYDSRQQATDQLKKLNLNVESTRQSYDKLKKIYDQYQGQYDAGKKEYYALQEQYNSEKLSYDTSVNLWNGRGGAPKQIYEQLKLEQDHLNTLVLTLNQKADALNQLIENINALALTLNRIGGELNLDVSVYNSFGKNLGEFQEGVFTADNSGKRIVIYQFDSYDTLVRVLAHELGHSLGLEHVADLRSIMYKLNQSKNEKPTGADIAELKRVCKL